MPTALKIAAGNAGKRAINKREPKASGIPTPPGHLSDLARRHWFALCPLLKDMGILSRGDGAALEQLAECYAEVQELRADIRANGRVQSVTTKSGDVFERQRPVVAMYQDADRRLKSYLVEFGLTPAARSKVHASEVEDNQKQSSYFVG